MPPTSETRIGAREAIPICLGYLPLGFAFGVLAKASGLSILEAVFMSAMNFTGAGQYIAIGLLPARASFMTIWLTNLLVNQRYSLFSTSLVPHLKSIPTRTASLLMLGLTDEVYAVSYLRFTRHQATTAYLTGLVLTSYASWVGSSFLGAIFGSFITDTDRFGLNFALPAMYAILLVLVINRRRDLVVALVAAGVCLLMAGLFPATLANYSNIIVAALTAATVGVFLRE